MRAPRSAADRMRAAILEAAAAHDAVVAAGTNRRVGAVAGRGFNTASWVGDTLVVTACGEQARELAAGLATSSGPVVPERAR